MSGWRTGATQERKVTFSFDGKRLQGIEGESLASALIANGVDIVGRSFKYHRPRGIMAAGAQDPSGLVSVRVSNSCIPNLRATEIILQDGLDIRSQNVFPSRHFDVGAVLDHLSPLIRSGFYYKTFMKPRFMWPFFEKMIRNAAGMGRASLTEAEGRFLTRTQAVDVLVIGGGLAGLSAALHASEDPRLRVAVVDMNAGFGGETLLDEAGRAHWQAWVDDTLATLRSRANVHLFARTRAVAHHDGNIVAAIEQLDAIGLRQCRHFFNCGRVVLASGALERPLLFGHNDRPGVYLASAARRYLAEHGAVVGRMGVLYCNNDWAYQSVFELVRAGVSIAGVIEQRSHVPAALTKALADAGVPFFPDSVLIRSYGRRRVRGVRVSVAGVERTIPCDTVLTSGGYLPTTALFTHCDAGLRWCERIAAFVPDTTPQTMQVAGACAGVFDATLCTRSGQRAGLLAAGHDGADLPPEPACSVTIEAQKIIDTPKQFVDIQNDVTVSELAHVAREGFWRPEHAKRYTMLGMGTDQGRMAGLTGIQVLATQTGSSIAQLGNTRPRPPFTPVSFGACASARTGEFLSPIRRTPLDRWHEEHGAVMGLVGAWRRPRYYARSDAGESDTIMDEVRTVRTAVGVTDVSTLGKIELVGADVPALLDRAYINDFSSLKVGRVRYGVMLRDDGIVFDDGTVSRMADDRWFMTTTTGNLEKVLQSLEHIRQDVFPGKDIGLSNVTDNWAAVAVAGPRSRELLGLLADAQAFGNEAFPFMQWRALAIAGIACRVLRVSFSGELAYEVYCPPAQAQSLWEQLLHHGQALCVRPYGTEAMMTLRIEKGLFVPGFEADGRTGPYDLGLERMLSTKKDFVGRAVLQARAGYRPYGRQLVGILAQDSQQEIPVGAQLLQPADTSRSIGVVTSVTFSPALNRWVALVLVENGQALIGQPLLASAPLDGASCPVTVQAPVFIDPEGVRLRA